MKKKAKKKGENSKRDIIIIILAAVIIIILGIFIVKKPSITGFAVISKETVYSDNLDIVVNESKSTTWNLRNPGNLKTIKATGAISRNGSAKVYVQKDGERRLIFDSTKQLFDVNVKVLPDYKKIFQRDELLIQIVLFNLRGFGSADVNVKYSIKDRIGNIIAAEEETVTVETQATFVRKLLIPADLKPGSYAAFVEVVTPDGLIGTSSDSFEVAVKYGEAYPVQTKYLGLGIAMVIVLAVVIIFSRNYLKKLKKKKSIEEMKKKTPVERVDKLEKELKALESAYKSGLISEASYDKDKERIGKEIKKLKR